MLEIELFRKEKKNRKSKKNNRYKMWKTEKNIFDIDLLADVSYVTFTKQNETN